jgi:arylsulfatase A-like enzyme
MRTVLFVIATSVVTAATSICTAADRPNVVWILSEDNSIHYVQHFFPGGAAMPNVEALAKDGLTFDHAFSNSPVCSVARTTLATGCYGPRIGTQFHRRYKLAEMPPGLRMFPAYLRDAGYYTTNNSKKDYAAVEGPGVWDESSRKASWRNRPTADQAFFHMESHAQSHESSLHFNTATYENEETEHDPQTVALADYFPDTPLFRYTHARYLDKMKVIDGIVGNTVQKLKDDGLLEDTFVFYFGDHGGVLPRGKGYIYESGLHVPLVVRIPQNFRHLIDAKRGERLNGFVNFIDFGPTVLNLAGIPVPEQVDGRPFLGQGVTKTGLESRDEAFGYADRFDEKYDLLRSLRKGKYQYIRCYQPWLPDGLMNIYRYKMLAYNEWQDLWKAGKLDGAPAQFYQPKPVETLFDTEADPHEVRNLANDDAYADVLIDLRTRLQQKMRAMPDLSLYPESRLVADALDNAVEFGLEHKEEIGDLLTVADLELLPFAEARAQVLQALNSDNPTVRYWGVMSCCAFGGTARELTEAVANLLEDDSPIVRVRAAEFLGIVGDRNPQPILTQIVNTTRDEVLAVEALNSIVYFRDFFDDRYPAQRSDFDPIVRGGDIDDRLNYLNGIPYPKQQRKKAKR